jgi:hypothetical protein
MKEDDVGVCSDYNHYLGVDENDGDNSDNGHHIINLGAKKDVINSDCKECQEICNKIKSHFKIEINQKDLEDRMKFSKLGEC